jgi:hypothetical protein
MGRDLFQKDISSQGFPAGIEAVQVLIDGFDLDISPGKIHAQKLAVRSVHAVPPELGSEDG